MSQPDPWEAFCAKHQRCDRITSRISRIVHDIGLFIALDGGIEGIVHLSDLDWTLAGENALRHYKAGDSVETVILSIRPDLQRISLGIKQLGPDPRQDRHDEPPAPAPVKPAGPRSPKPHGAAVNRE